MNKRIKSTIQSFLSLCIVLILSQSFLQAQILTSTDGKFTYEYVENDPMNSRIYTLDNGMKVYLTVNKDAPRIQTYIAVATGGKNDPHDAQGLSHYLEHMLFKGTDKFGTKDYESEQPLIDTIIALYELRRQATDPEERKNIYRRIDSISYLASEFAIANEFDKMITDIGGTGTNAYTSVEQTVYVGDIPSNQIEKWLTIEAERFRKPVMRLFHTELEAVYEEKNRGLDSDGRKAWEAFMSGLFQKHTYGTQSILGSVEQLQNPSIQKIIDYYNERYVPNNMAICMSGDLDFQNTIDLINEKFGGYQYKEVPKFISPVEAPITSPIVKEVLGPSAEYVMFGYRTEGANTKTADILQIVDNILSNGSAGLIDLNLNQDQKVINAYSSIDINKDYSTIYFGGNPREGQTLEQVKDLLMDQIELLKKGQFPNWLIPAIISNIKLRHISGLESNSERADAFVTSFILGIPWDEYILYIDRLSKITKQDVIDFANENLNENYVIVYKRTGEDTSIQKIDKPEISPVKMNQDDKSEFVETVLSKQTEDIRPEFIDFKSEIKEMKLKNDIPLFYLKNNENELYKIFYIIEAGSNQNKKLSLAAEYLDYLGTSKYTSQQLKEEFYKLASSFGISVSEDETTVSLSGLNENFSKASELLEDLFSEPKANKDALDNLVQDILKQREDAKLSKRTILWSGMFNFAKYGKDNPFTYRLSENELMNIKPEELIEIIKDLFSYKQRVLYYGPSNSSEIVSSVNKIHQIPSKLRNLPVENKFIEKSIDENIVYVVNYDMQQVEIVMLSKGESYDKRKVPIITLYNEYFGGGMGSLVFQDLRESKALAYSAFSTYQNPPKLDRSSYNYAYIGSQADKLPEAVASMSALLNDMPQVDITFNSSKNSLLKQIQSERITKANILFQFESSKKLGLDYDIRKDIYDNITKFELDDVVAFQSEFVKNKPHVMLVLGDIKKLDMKILESYGKVSILSLKDIYGY